MIEINLVPDVKQEYIRAKRVRNTVVSTAVLVGLAAIAIVVVLALYAFPGQSLRSSVADDAIKTKHNTLNGISDLQNSLTVQNQLSKISELHDQENIYSRFFDLLVAINPPAPNQVSFSLARVDSDTKTIHLEGQAANGYNAVDVLKKTILGTSLRYRDSDGQSITVPLTDNVSTAELTYGEDSTGKKVLRFTLMFSYADPFFDRKSKDAIIVRPDRQNVTDSYKYLPLTLFTDRTMDQGGAN